MHMISNVIPLLMLSVYCARQLCGAVNLTADRLLLLDMENSYLKLYLSSNCPMRRSTKSERDIMNSLDECEDSDALLDKMITKVQDALERVVAFIKIHGSSTTLSRMQLKRLQKYRNQLHGDNFISVFTCPICSIKSITFIGLWKHMAGLHNIYLRAKGMLSTIIAQDFITPRKLILKKRQRNLVQVNDTSVNTTETSAPRRVLKKIRRRKLNEEVPAPTTPLPTRKRQVVESAELDFSEQGY
uniref:Uncharacterized protein n=1 Tax=Cacopsylla melanoneura TaxID=428564 RepID=A0A8D9AQT6_9HEMI